MDRLHTPKVSAPKGPKQTKNSNKLEICEEAICNIWSISMSHKAAVLWEHEHLKACVFQLLLCQLLLCNLALRFSNDNNTDWYVMSVVSGLFIFLHSSVLSQSMSCLSQTIDFQLKGMLYLGFIKILNYQSDFYCLRCLGGDRFVNITGHAVGC